VVGAIGANWAPRLGAVVEHNGAKMGPVVGTLGAVVGAIGGRGGLIGTMGAGVVNY
jgi:hypothetical protein